MKKTEKEPTPSTVTQGEQILKRLLLTRFSMRQLVAYIAVYDYRNIQAAAHDLYLDHSTVSKSISEIEAALNMQLFIRHTRGVTPTAAADVFYRHSKQIANQCTRTAAELSRIATGGAIHIVIGCVSYLDTIAIKAISRFKLQHDNKLVVRLIFGHTGDLHRRLKLDEIDLVICRLGTHAEQPDIHAEKVYDVGDIIVVRPDHPCASQPDITLEKLIQYPWILPPPNNPFRSYLESMFHQEGLPLPSNVFEIASTFAARGILLDNPNVVCTLPSKSISGDLQQGSLLQLDLPIKLSQPPVGVLHRRSLTMDAYADSLILSLRETANEA
ncbi:MAG TPA: LysR family transcriptional regulator [Steroidobacteraceae bacterium]|jgi:LysR family pca operon transcriptional activator